MSARRRLLSLAGRVIVIPSRAGRRLPLRLRIIEVQVAEADPDTMIVSGIRIERTGREFEGHTIVLTTTQLREYLI